MKTIAVMTAALLVVVVLPIVVATALFATFTSSDPADAGRLSVRPPAVGSASGVIQAGGEDVICQRPGAGVR